MVVESLHHRPLYLNLAPFDTSGVVEPADRDMIKDYTAFEHWFVLKAPLGVVYQIHWLRFVIDVSPADAQIQTRGYGILDANLPSPIQVEIVEGGDDDGAQTIVDLTYKTELNVAAHWHWARAGFSSMADFAYRQASPAPWDAMVFTMNVEETFGAPILLRGNWGSQILVKTGANNFLAFSRHRLIVSGLQHSDLYSANPLSLQVAPAPGGGGPIE